MRKHLVAVGFVAVLGGLPSVQASHTACEPIPAATVYQPGVGGVAVGHPQYDSAPGEDTWVGPCVLLIQANGTFGPAVTVRLGLADAQPDAVGVQFMAGYCLVASGCGTTIQRTGFEFVEGPGTTTGGEFACVGTCVNDQRHFVGTLELYAHSVAPVLRVPICASLGTSAGICPSIG